MRYLLSTFAALALFAQTQANEITDIVRDTQKVTQTATEVGLVWWIPQAFWETSFEQDPSMTQGQKEEFLRVLEDYTVFAIVQSNIGTFGSFTHKSKDEIRDNISLTIKGQEIEQVPYISIKQDVSNFFIMMKPLMAQMMGELGKGMEFIVFPNKKGKETLLDPRSEGSFTFTSFENEYNWRLPLGSLMPPVFDADTGEQFPGNYKFNPFNGNKLVSER